ncbi:hypothetical protein EYF80_037426 [Liparis tanakae]|uniref:Uncharacterized protein n=1 Tax=Liparis tanakae TaxID=230148 RepID=A0A4Z2GHH0_9TELE|nr:hypothetical protein EYF80_037426 [Liparis tanakae]
MPEFCTWFTIATVNHVVNTHPSTSPSPPSLHQIHQLHQLIMLSAHQHHQESLVTPQSWKGE